MPNYLIFILKVIAIMVLLGINILLFSFVFQLFVLQGLLALQPVSMSILALIFIVLPLTCSLLIVKALFFQDNH